jgi:hypothetical protein
MLIREFAYYNDSETRAVAREAARNFAEWVCGKVYNDRFHNVFVVAWGPGTENMTDEM